MKGLKLLGLLVVAAGVAMAVTAGTASATELDCGATMCAVGQEVHAENEGTVTLHPPIGDLECKKSTMKGKLANTGSSVETVRLPIETLTFTECNATISVLKKGELIFHTDTNDSTGTSGNGTLTWNGMETTTEFAGFHCIFTTNNTDIGTVTGSTATKSTATLDIAATIPRTGGRSGAFCGSTAQWTGAYKFNIPDTLNVT